MANKIKQLEEENKRLQCQIERQQQLDKELADLKRREKDRKEKVRLEKLALKNKYKKLQ